MDINCPHFDLCSGCSLNQHVDKPAVLLKANEFFATQSVTNFKLNIGKVKGWRCRAKLAARFTETIKLGLFEKNSHSVVDIPLCQVHHELINEAAQILREWISKHAIELYQEEQGLGCLRYVQLTVERETKRVQLVLVVNERQDQWPNRQLEKNIEEVQKSHPALWHSIWLNFNRRQDNVIFTPRWQLVHGEEWLWERLDDCDICFHPASFMQANLEMFERLIGRVQELVPVGAKVVEFYAGVGAIGLSLVKKCESVKCVEIVPLAERCFNQSLARLSKDVAKRIEYFCGQAESYTKLLENETNVVIVDPPRKGLDEKLLHALLKVKTKKRLIYISCGWESFQKDCQKLISSGWKLVEAEAYLFFPGSEHIETLAVFESCKV